MPRTRIIVTVVIALAIIGGGMGVAVLLVKTGPEAVKEETVEAAAGVEVHLVSREKVPLTLATQGVIEANRATVLASEVSGRVVEVAPKFEAGGVFAADELMLRIERADYQAAVAAAEATVASAREQLALEEARAVQGRRDWQRLGRGGEPDDLVLRVPQLERARAALASSGAALERAERDLERTEIRAPYACQVRSEGVDLGAVVAPGAVLGEVISSRDLEVRLPLSLKDYGFLKTDEAGRPMGAVTLRTEVGGRAVEWQGRIVRSENEVERKTLSIYVVAVVEASAGAPAGFDLPPVGLFVQAEIEGRALANVVALPRSAIRNRSGDRGQVFVVEEGEVLGMRDVRIRLSDRETAYIDEGLKAGDRVVLTKLDAPVAGKPLEIIGGREEAQAKAAEAGAEATAAESAEN